VLAAGLVCFIPKPSRKRETHTQIAAEPLVELERGDAGRESVGEARGEGSVQVSTLQSQQGLGQAGGEIVGVESVGEEGSLEQQQQLQQSTPAATDATGSLEQQQQLQQSTPRMTQSQKRQAWSGT
jgi:hypothetical protein